MVLLAFVFLLEELVASCRNLVLLVLDVYAGCGHEHIFWVRHCVPNAPRRRLVEKHLHVLC